MFNEGYEAAEKFLVEVTARYDAEKANYDRENLLKEARDLAATVAAAEAEFAQRNATRATDMAPLKSDYDTAKGAVDGIKVDMAAQQAIMDGSAEG